MDPLETAMGIIESSGVLSRIRPQRTGRPSTLSAKAVLSALLALALTDRPLHLSEAARLIYAESSPRAELGVTGADPPSFAAACRRVAYRFHQITDALHLPGIEIDPERLGAIEDFVNAILTATVPQSPHSLFGLDATCVPAFSRGPSKHTETKPADPQAGWYVRDGDHRDAPGPGGRRLPRIAWALEATVAVTGDAPVLSVAMAMGIPGHDPGGTGARMAARLGALGHGGAYIAADRAYSNADPGNYHLALRSMGFKPVMDYRIDALGVQAQCQGANLVEGGWHCPGMPAALVGATAERRKGEIDSQIWQARIAARTPYRLVPIAGPDAQGYRRYGCPAVAGRVQCPLKGASPLASAKVFDPPEIPPPVCTQRSITVAPSAGARHFQEHAFGSPKWAETYAKGRNAVEGMNGYVKDPSHQALAAPARRRVRGIAAQSIFVAMLLSAANLRKLASLAEKGETTPRRARRRKEDIANYRPS